MIGHQALRHDPFVPRDRLSDVLRSGESREVREASASLFITFLLALAIKRGGGDEWIYALALVAAGFGAFAR